MLTSGSSLRIDIDSFLPPEMALKAESIGIKKAEMGVRTLFALAVLAGAFISLGGIFATTVTSPGIHDGIVQPLPFGVSRLLGGFVFSLGLILVIIGGAELFTGNNLIVMAWANHKVSTGRLLKNWLIVYLGNFVGAFATAIFMLLSQQYWLGSGAVGLNALNIASAKTGLEFIPAVVLGMFCNTLVCLAVWLCFSARTTTDKILSIVFPITAFVAAGFEHSIANMYFIPMGLLIKTYAPLAFWAAIGKTAADYATLTWGSFLVRNLLPVTIGNIVGGAFMVGISYWFIYLRPKHSAYSPALPPEWS